MKVPEEIRKVKRPVNTIVEDSGRDGPKRYSVRERSAVKYVPGKNPQPHNGKVVGHIINFKFVPVDNKASTEAKPKMLSYGSVALAKSVCDDITDDLLAVYDAGKVYSIMSLAIIRVIRPSTPLSRVSAHYRRTFTSVFFPGAAVSQNSLGNLIDYLGVDEDRRKAFFLKRISSVMAEHHIAIDGTLKQDNSTVNDLSAFSYKARVKNTKDISVIYAYDIEKMEPVCAQVFPGNCIDASAYSTFIRNNNIDKGIIVADKGFPPSKIKNELNSRPNLHFLTPIKRNDVRIKDNDMLSFQGVLSGIAANVLYCKKQIKGGRYLYAFLDQSKSSLEAKTFLTKAKQDSEFDYEKYCDKKDKFGLIVLESDQDLPPVVAYTCYEERWKLEMVFKYYKMDEDLDRTRVQGDFAVIGSEFVNFISTLITCRIINKAQKSGVLKEMSYGEMMDDLSSAWRMTDAPLNVPASSDDEYWVHTLNTVMETLEKLGLSVPAAKPEPKKRGRKPKVKEQSETTPRRPRGRPRKVTVSQNTENLVTIHSPYSA